MTFTKSDFEQARIKHILFKSKLRALLSGAGIDETPIVSERECSLGKWIYDVALPCYPHLPEMKALEQIHSEMHITARDLVRKFHEGRTDEAWEGLTRINTIAARLVELLNVLEIKLT